MPAAGGAVESGCRTQTKPPYPTHQPKMYYLATEACQRLPAPLAGRYTVVNRSPLVVRDLYPERESPPPDVTLDTAQPYQRLNPWRWAIPEVHAQITPGRCLLLDNAPLEEDGAPWPTLGHSWPMAQTLRQLGWLLQLAKLWEPCCRQKVASSLLASANIGVQGWQVRLFYLTHDRAPVSLQALGASWLALTPMADELCAVVQALTTGKFDRLDALVAALEALAAQTNTGCRVQAVTSATHPGRRELNEDCLAYDPQGRFAVVCDGMGGHEGGKLASLLAISSLQQDFACLSDQALPPSELRAQLANAAQRAHQRLWRLNQRQGRSGRRQLGTTVAACFLRGPLLHTVHVGDSRVYLIDRRHCQQLSVDDDVLNLEVSLARTTRQVLHREFGSGQLTQALGVIPPNNLKPTTQSFVLPEDCLVLLCSDGLSDGDFVERHWRETLLPLLDGGNLEAAGAALVEMALLELGHDNISFVMLQYATAAPRSDGD